jgi:hypothetical protein
MKFRFWPRRGGAEPVAEADASTPAVTEAPVESAPVEPAPAPPEAVRVPPPAAETTPAQSPEAPTTMELTIDEAKNVIREAGGDVIQVGFLASAYRRHLAEDPHSSETAASRKRLRELVGKRLKDRGLLAPDGTFELREEPSLTE